MTQDLVEPRVMLTWHGLEQADDISVGSAREVTLRVTNLGDRPLRVAPRSTLYALGRSRVEAAAPTLLAANSEVDLTFSLATPGVDWRSARSPGNVFVEVDLRGADGGVSLGRAISSTLYFHESAGQLAVYGEGPLRDRFRRGDLKGSLRADDRVIAVIDATAGGQADEEVRP